MCVLFFHVVQSLVFLLLPWKDERPPFPPLAASGCLWLPGTAERSCTGLPEPGLPLPSRTLHEQGERSAGSISPRTLFPAEREGWEPGVPPRQTLLCPRVKPSWPRCCGSPSKGPAPRVCAQLWGQDQPPLSCRGTAHLGQVSLGPWGRWVCFQAVPVTVELTWPGA